jgi:hypothetical protein
MSDLRGIGKKAPDGKPLQRKPLIKPDFPEMIEVNNERELLGLARKLEERIAAQPEFSVMLLANPVLALRAYGVKLSPQLEHHVLTSLRHPPKLRARRRDLEASLEKALGEPPRPTEPEWLAGLVHTTRKLPPREIGKLEPAYKPPLSAERIATLRAKRPPATSRYPGVRRLPVKFALGVAPSRPTIRRLDLDAALPRLEPARTAPTALTIEQAWFYKDDPVVRDAVELGVIIRRGFHFSTPDEFRRTMQGERVDAFRAFVGKVGIKSAARKAPPGPKSPGPKLARPKSPGPKRK